MGLFIPIRQATLHIPETGPQKQGHLFIIVTNRCADGLHLLVPVCSERKGCDRTCLLGVGDHKFIKHPSYIDYGLASIRDGDVLAKRVMEGPFSYEGILEERVFALVSNGVLQSRFTEPKIKKYFADNS